MFRCLSGGRFIWRENEMTYYLKRDAEVVTEVNVSGLGTFGLAGSDAVGEDPIRTFAAEDLMPIRNSSGQPLRFALATRNRAVDIARLKQKVTDGEPLCIATSYPVTLRKELQATGLALGATIVRQGGIEALLWQYEQEIDAIFELVQSGNSIRDNELVVVQDNIKPVMLQKVDVCVMQEGAL